eukprot:gene4193-5964_t
MTETKTETKRVSKPSLDVENRDSKTISSALHSLDQILQKEEASTFFLFLKDSNQQKEFTKFCELKGSMFSFTLLFTAFFSFGMIYFVSRAITLHSRPVPSSSNLTLDSAFVLFVIVMLIGFIFFYERYYRAIFHSKTMIETIFAIGSSIDVSLILIGRVLGGTCVSSKIRDSWSCNPEESSKAVLQDILFLSFLLPILFSVIFRAVKWEVIGFIWTNSVFTAVLSIIISNNTYTASTLIFYVPISLIVLFESRRQHLAVFFVTQNLQQLIIENERNAEIHASELRHMIANVAHDLKTPLSGFISGVEFITTIVNDLSEIMGKFPIDEHALRSNMQISIEEIIKEKTKSEKEQDILAAKVAVVRKIQQDRRKTRKSAVAVIPTISEDVTYFNKSNSNQSVGIIGHTSISNATQILLTPEILASTVPSTYPPEYYLPANFDIPGLRPVEEELNFTDSSSIKTVIATTIPTTTTTTLTTASPPPTETKLDDTLSILIVDDSLSILKMTGMMLKRHGHTVEQAENGSEAVDKMSGTANEFKRDDNKINNNRSSYSFIQSMISPRTMGSSLSSDIDKEKDSASSYLNLRHQIIIGCSANSDNDTMQEALAAGIDTFIGKPFTMLTFNSTCNQLNIIQSKD